MSTEIKNVNEMTIQEAAKYYSQIGIVSHPLKGKQSTQKEWQKLTKTPFDKFKSDNDIGFVCGKVSNLTVVDVDWYVPGIWNEILQGVDASEFVKQAHTEGKWHWLFGYCKELKAGQYQALGFDILSDSAKYNKSTKDFDIVGNNCVAAPSVHADSKKYQIVGLIENRPQMPEIVVKRINNIIFTYEDLTKKIIPKCRKVFQELWKGVFIQKNGEYYHEFPVYRNNLLALMAELKAAGASDLQLQLVCMLIFGGKYDERKSEAEIKQIDVQVTAKYDTLAADNYFSQFFKVKDEVSKEKAKDENEDEINPLDIDFDEQGIKLEMLEAAEREADDILAHGDPIDYILKTIAKSHTGDDDTEEAICISIAGQSCLNTAGIQVSVCGASGSGKSHGVMAHMHLVPNRFKRSGSLSAKAVFYHKLRQGMIIFSDDTKVNADMEDTIKKATTNYQGIMPHFTVKDQKGETLTIPPRVNWYLTHVDPQASEQLLNRQLVFETSPNSEQDQEVFDMQINESMTGEAMTDVGISVLVCRRIYTRIKELEPIKIVIPFADRITLGIISNRRIYPQLRDMIFGYAILKYQQRKKNETGLLMAEEEDFWRAKRLFESRIENTVTHLTDPEKKIVDYIIKHQESDGCTVNEIADGTGLSTARVYPIINGSKDKPDSGLLYKVKGMRRVERPNVIGRPSKCYKIENPDMGQFSSKDFVSLVGECAS